MDEYGAVRKLLHWLVAILVVGQIGLGAYLAYAPPQDHALVGQLFGIHHGLGASILVLMLLRLVLRLILGVPVLPRGVPRFAEWLGGVNHALLYLLLIIEPVIGYLRSGAGGHDWSIFGYYSIPAIIAKDPALADILKEAHEGVAAALIVLIVLHLLGAFYHGVIRRDGVVGRMA